MSVFDCFYILVREKERKEKEKKKDQIESKIKMVLEKRWREQSLR